MINGDGIDEAAEVFDATISSERGNLPAPPKPNGSAKPSEAVFQNLGEAEIDDESPAKGGGDDDDALYSDPPGKKKKSDESDDEDDQDEDSDEEDEGEEDESLGSKYKVMVDGQEREVSLKEALEGYIRTETFHKRLSEIGQTQQVVQRAAKEVVQNYEHAKQLCDLMESQMNEMVPPEPDWDRLFAEDPAKARNLQKYYEQIAGFKQKLKQQREDVNKAIETHQSQQLRSFAQAEELRFSRLNAKNWGTDPKRKAKDLQSMRRTGGGR